jgi:hypothetical protein
VELSGQRPVAPALQPPRFRRVLLVSAAALLAVAALSAAFVSLQKLGVPTPCGWRVTPTSGKVAIERGRRIVFVLNADWLLTGDRLHLDAQETATLEGLHGLAAKVTGPAVLCFEPQGGMLLEEGRLTVTGPGPTAAGALRLRTLEGAVRAEGKDGFALEVEARAGK